MSDYMMPLAGGVLIGIAITLMLLWNGRVAGVSGILNGALGGILGGALKRSGDVDWRLSFLAGLIIGGFALRGALPEALVDTSDRSWVVTIIAGLLVGFGTVMGGGCTSGHGICGMSRLSKRSIVATLVFMICGILTATVFRVLVGAA